MLKRVLSVLLTVFLLTVCISSASLGGEPVENALSARNEDSVYFMMKTEDVSSLLKWFMSDANVNTIMPLILSSEDSNDIMGSLELFKAFTDNTPLKSLAFVVGTDRPESGDTKPVYFQMAFTVNDELSTVVKKISDGTAEDKDFIRLIFGLNSPLAPMFETMLKAEKLDNNIYKVDNELYVKAENGIVIAGITSEDLALSFKALADEEVRLMSNVKRRLTNTENYVLAHVDYETVDRLDTKGELNSADIATEFFDKPFNFELGFESLPDRFILDVASNIRDALKAKYAASLDVAPPSVKGCYIDLREGGSESPLLALGGFMNIEHLKYQAETKDAWNDVIRQLKLRYGITEEEFVELFTGPFTLSVNDSVTFEGMKIPAIYIRQTGRGGSAGKVFEKLTKSNHFRKVADGVLQMDTSLSPVSCLVQDKGETLTVNFAELPNLSSKPVIKPVLADLINSEGISAVWIDFDEIRKWVTDDRNGVFAMALPMAKMMGFGEVAEAVREVLNAEFSVPSMSFEAMSVEHFRLEFTNVAINPENGLIAKLVNIYRKFNK